MKKILMGAVALSLLAAPAFAQSASTVNVSGTVGAACSAALPAQSIDLNTQLGGSLIDADGFSVAAMHQPGSIAAWTGNASAWCNSSSTITVAASPLSNVTIRERTVPAGFARLFDMEVTGFGIGARTVPGVTTAGAAASQNSSGSAFAGPLAGTVRILPLASGIRPLAGTYAGSVSVTVAVN